MRAIGGYGVVGAAGVYYRCPNDSGVVVDDTLPRRLWKSPWHEEGRNLLQGHASPALLLSPASLRARLLGTISSATILGPKTACFPRCYIELFVSRARRRLKCRKLLLGPPSPAGEGPNSGRKVWTKRLLQKSGGQRALRISLPGTGKGVRFTISRSLRADRSLIR